MSFVLTSVDENRFASLAVRGTLRRLAACALVAGAALFLSACKSGYPVSARQGGETKEAREIRIARVTEMPFERAVTVTGTLAAFDKATISAKVAGRVRVINVDLGSVVRQGQAIAELETRDAQLRLQQAEAALAQARARLGLAPDGSDDSVDLEQTATVRQARAVLEEASLKRDRAIRLLQQGIVSRAELDAAEAEFKIAQSRHQDAVEEIRNRQAVLVQRRSEVEIARQQLTDMSIRAPFEGVVEERIANRGEYLAVGSPIATIVRMNPLRLRAEVPERESRSVRAGQQVRVTVEGETDVHTGRIARLSPSISAQNRVLIIEAEVINNGRLRPGAFARADIVADSSSLALAVPTNSIVTFAGIDKVISVQDGKAVEKPVALGRRTAEWTEILSGVKAGDVVVIEPGNLQSGQPVSVGE
jgi:RND family efflux transporter MFP subunit